MQGQPLLVELYLSNARVRGMTGEVEERRRLVDVLNGPEGAFHLDAAKLVSGAAADGRNFPNLSVEKRSILIAVPYETREQTKHRAMQRAWGGRTETTPREVTVILPPFIVEGTAHIPYGAGMILGDLHADPSVFSHFIPVTSVKLTLPNGSTLEVPVALLNRDAIAGMSLARESKAAVDVTQTVSV